MIVLSISDALIVKSLRKLGLRNKFFSTSNVQSSSSNPYRPKQIIDPEQVIDQKVNQLSQTILKSKYPIFFTGAGISTSLGIPDYRSGSDTIIKTGPGLWNRSIQQVKVIQHKRNSLIDQLIPSLTHMAIYTLISQNVFKHLVSQNTDGLHLRSGINKNHLSELHGNRNLEYCINCQRKYLRDFRTIKKNDKDLKPGQKREHLTGRNCQNCSGELHDSIVYFGQKLPKDELIKSYEQGAKSDLCLAIGSSLTVKPSSNIPLLPLKYNKEGKLAIINIQQTTQDQYCQVKINGFCDQVMRKLMNKLKIPIAVYKVQRYLEINVLKEYDGWTLRVNGVDAQHYNFSYIKRVKILKEHSDLVDQVEQEQETRILDLRNMFEFRLSSDNHDSLSQINIKVEFFGPFADLSLNLRDVFDSNDIIGHQSKILKLTSTNNQSWDTFKTN